MSKRIEYMDALRGFAILTVVYQHLIVMGLSNTAYQSSVSKLIVLFFMPLFFFISGYFSLKIESINTLRELWCVYVKKIKTLLVPTIIMFSFCIFYFHLDFKHYIFEPNKSGYWFTWALFCIVVMFTVASYVVTNSVSKAYYGGAIHLILAVLLHWGAQHLDMNNPLNGLLSVKLVLENYLYFVFGYIFHKKMNTVFLKKLFFGKWSTSVMLLLSLIPYIYQVQWYIKNACCLMLVLVIYNVFQHYKEFFDKSSFLAKLLKNCGLYSLEIYFLHYFLLFRQDFLVTWLTSFSMDYCFRGHSCQFLIEVIFIGGSTILIAISCIFISKMLRAFPIVSKLCFGKY